MMFAPGLAVVFAGLLGGKGDVDTQVKKVVSDLHVKSVSLPAASVQKLTHYGAATRAVVRDLHADGVIACEVVKVDGATTLRIVIYEGDGKLKTFSEVPMTGTKLSRAQLDALRSNLSDELADMRDDDAPAPAIAESTDRAKRNEPSAPLAADDEDPLTSTAGTKAPTTPTPPKPTPAPMVATADEAATDDDAVSADEIAALTATSDAEPATPARTLRFGAAAGIGVATRTFNAGPSTVLPYASSPVPAVVVDAHVQPTNTIRLEVGFERTLQLSTPMRDGSGAPTTFSRWDATGTFSLIQRGSFDVGLLAGGGRRAFSIDSTETARSPDSDYNYAVAGLATTMHVGNRIVLRASGAFEPVLWGNEQTEMALGEAVRWAFELGGSVEVRAASHVFVRAAAQYQRFSWAWNMAGTRGEGGATDTYPSGLLSLGADY